MICGNWGERVALSRNEGETDVRLKVQHCVEEIIEVAFPPYICVVGCFSHYWIIKHLVCSMYLLESAIQSYRGKQYIVFSGTR